MDKITKIVLVGWRRRDIVGKSVNHLDSVASGGLAFGWRIIVKLFITVCKKVLDRRGVVPQQ